MLPHRRAILTVHLAAVLVGFTALFGKLPVPPGAIVAGRSAFAAAALLLVIWWQGASLRLRSRRDAAAFVLAGGLLAAHWAAFFHSIQVSTVGVGVLSVSTFPVFIALLEPALFRERYHRLDLLGGLMVTAGVLCVTPQLSLANNLTQGVVWGLLAALLYALLSLLNRHQARHYSAPVISFYLFAGAALFAAPSCFLGPPVAYTGRTWALLALLGVAFTAVPQSLIVASLRYLRAQLMGIIISLEPIYGILFAWLLFREALTLRLLLGGALILSAVFLASRRPAPGEGSAS